MNKYSILVKNTLLVFGGGIGSKLIMLFMMPLYTRWLSRDGYGEMDLITIYATLLLSIVSCCIPEALFVFPSGETKINQMKFFSSGVLFNCFTIFLATCLFVVIDFFSKLYFWDNSFINNIWFIYIMMVSSIFQQQAQQFSRSTNHMIVYSLTGLIYTLIVFVLSFLLVKSNGVRGYVNCITIANIGSMLFCLYFAKIYKYLNFKYFRYSAVKEMLVYSIPLIPNSIIWWLVNAFNRPLMERYLGIQDVGIYAVANRFPSILTVLFAMFTASWQISAIEEFKSGTYQVFYNRIFKFVFNILICILLIIVLSSKLFVEIFADSDFFTAWKYIPILTFGTFISCISAFIGVNFSAARESKYFLYSSLYGAVVSIILNFVLIPLWGLWGACFSVVLSFFAIAISRYIYSIKYVHVSNIMYYVIMLICVISVMILYNFENYLLCCISAILIIFYLVYKNLNDFLTLTNKLCLLFRR